MKRTWLVASTLACAVAYAAPGFKQTVPFPAFETWAKGGAVPGFSFQGAKDEAESYQAFLKGGAETLTLKIEGAGKFDGLAAKSTRFTWKGLEAQYITSASSTTIAVRYGNSKATLSAASSKVRTQADMEKLLAELKPERILK